MYYLLQLVVVGGSCGQEVQAKAVPLESTGGSDGKECFCPSLTCAPAMAHPEIGKSGYTTVIHTLVTSHLDYYNPTWGPPMKTVQKVENVRLACLWVPIVHNKLHLNSVIYINFKYFSKKN